MLIPQAMLVTRDLRLEEDILPLFNYTNNDGAEAALRQLLLTLPNALTLVLERQATLRGLLARWDRLADFSYSRVQYTDAWQLLHDVSSGRLELDQNRLLAALRLRLSEEARYAQRAKFVQLIQLLHRLHERVLEPLAGADLPARFKAQLALIRRLHEQLGTAALAQAIVEDRLTISQLVELGQRLQALSPADVHAFWAAFYEFEAYWSAARAVRERGLCLPALAAGTFELTDFYHPLLKAPVKNSLVLSAGENVVLLTGPNMSGKSTLLKAVGLCVYLAHAGLGVPAASAVLPFFDAIAVTINAHDSLLDGYSHFMVELQTLKQVLTSAGHGQPIFAVFDELFRGTNVDDALDLTRATVAGLARYPGSYFFVSTHLLQLEEQLPAVRSNIRQLSIGCTLHEGVPQFTYRLEAGWTALRLGRILFERAGLPELLSPPGS
jgi:DNA mismatch repair protein MutS